MTPRGTTVQATFSGPRTAKRLSSTLRLVRDVVPGYPITAYRQWQWRSYSGHDPDDQSRRLALDLATAVYESWPCGPQYHTTTANPLS